MRETPQQQFQDKNYQFRARLDATLDQQLDNKKKRQFLENFQEQFYHVQQQEQAMYQKSLSEVDSEERAFFEERQDESSWLSRKAFQEFEEEQELLEQEYKSLLEKEEFVRLTKPSYKQKGRSTQMGLKFVVSEAQERSSQAVKANNQAQEAVTSLQQSIQTFLSAPLSSKAYDSAKSYFMVAYTPICQSITMTGEALVSAHKKFISEYQATVSGADIDEDKLLAEIKDYEDLLHALDELIRMAKTPRPDLEKRSLNAFQVMQKRQEKLQKFRAYSAQSAGFFSEYESSQQELSTALAQVKECRAWNASTGTFDISRLDMNWAKPINERWKDYQDKKNGIDPDKNKELKKYTLIRCYDEINDRTTWSIEYNGERLDDPTLQAYLKKVGKYLSDKDYKILSLTPKEWETRINNQWKQGTEYFNGTKVPWVFQGLGHIQDYVQKRQNDGTWDTMWSLGFTFANIRNAINGGNKLKVSPNAKDHMSTSEGLVRKGGTGVVGAHDIDAFYGEITKNGFNIDDCIIIKTPHPSVKGIYEIEYRIPALDNKGNIIPNQYKKMQNPKTVYDTNYFSTDEIYKMGLNALEYGAINGRYVQGTAPNGLKFTGYLDKTGTLTNFFPTMK